MEIMKEYITNFLEQFDKKYRHKLEGIQVQVTISVHITSVIIAFNR